VLTIALNQILVEEQRINNELMAAILGKLTDQQEGFHSSSFQVTQDGENPAMVGVCDNGPAPDNKRELEVRQVFVA
jgi:hypothetical protein